MDTSDPKITFDPKGVCNHCHEFESSHKKRVKNGDEAKRELESTVQKIKNDGRGKPYDCVIGISGGVDSSFVAYQCHKLGLRPLAIHLDNGWDTELAVSNIEKLLNKLNIDLYTHVLEWEEFRDLQVAFLKCSTPDSEVISDHAILSVMYQMAIKYNVKYFVSGDNYRTESILPEAWSTGHNDWKYIRSVHRLFGGRPLKTFPHYGFWDQFYYSRIRKIEIVRILDLIELDQKEIRRILEQELGWRPYGDKHFESVYTRFFQGHILPKKFGFDKRRAHLSSLVCVGQISRDEALARLEHQPYTEAMQAQDRIFVVKKLGITDEEFENIMKAPHKTIYDYPNYRKAIETKEKIKGKIRSIPQFFRRATQKGV